MIPTDTANVNVDDFPYVPYKLEPHETPYGCLQQPMSRNQARHILASFHDAPPQSNDCLDWNNYAAALYIFRRDQEALDAARHAVSLDRNSTTLLMLGIILEGFGQFVEALQLFAEANESDPTSMLVGGAYSDALIRLGRWRTGWPLYALYHSHLFAGQLISLEQAAGKSLLIINTGGAGDSIYHLRWFRYLREAGCRITYAGPAELLALFEGHPWIDNLIMVPQEKPLINWYASGPPSFADKTSYCLNLNEFDYYLSSMSVAAVVKPRLDDSIWTGPYIKASSPTLTERLMRRVHRHPRIGVCWKAGEKYFSRAHRTLMSVQLDMLIFSPFLKNVQWVSLVKDARVPLGVEPTVLRDWRDTARVIASCDFIVSVDTGVVHLAGAMGKLVWVILPGASPWPYGLGDDYKCVYPSMRAFRNSGPGTDSSLDDLIGALRHELS